MDTKDTAEQWEGILDRIETMVGKRPADLNSVLFLIGVQELGWGPRRFAKEVKQDLMHIAVCQVLSESGYYVFDGHDKDGWPVWELAKPIPHGDLLTQEQFLKEHVITYFQSVLA